jgi:hypothetical protein
MSVQSIVTGGRRLIATSFLDSAFISDRTKVKDSTGGTKQTWVERSEPVRCRFVALTDEVATQVSGTEFGQATALWLAPLGTDVAEGDKIRNATVAGMWIVTRIVTPPSNLAVAVRVGIREV